MLQNFNKNPDWIKEVKEIHNSCNFEEMPELIKIKFGC